MRVVEGLISAERCTPRDLPRPKSALSRAGYTFERSVGREFKKLEIHNYLSAESGPWFAFVDRWGTGQAVPDFLLHTHTGETLIVECKLKWTPEAEAKLLGLYIPVVEAALKVRAYPLIVCRHLIPGVMNTVTSLRAALEWRGGIPTLQWLGRWRIDW